MGDHGYQALPGLKVRGERDTAHRLKVFRLGELPLAGADVADLGCNLGAFCFAAADHGARRVVGYDREFVAANMREVANWLGYYNVDFVGTALPDGLAGPPELRVPAQFDIVFCLSAQNYFGGYQPWIAELCRVALLLETHGDEDPAPYEAALRRDFCRVERLGDTTDVKRRAVFRCWKE